MINTIQEYIRDIETGHFILPDGVLNLEGYSSRKERQLLNHLCSAPVWDALPRYLEIGTHVGGCLIPALYGNQTMATVIDNWSLPLEGDRRASFYANLDKWLPDWRRRVLVIDHDCFTVPLISINRNKPFTVYFYDGDHTRLAQYMAFSYFAPVLADRFVAIVDDFNWAEPREETYRAIKDLGWTITHEWVLPARYERDLEEWWNGLFVGLIEKRRSV